MREIDQVTKPYWLEGQKECDITNIFSYITHNHGNYSSDKDIEDTINILDCYGNVIGSISNKLLTLYSEEELDNLYNLLKELGKN